MGARWGKMTRGLGKGGEGIVSFGLERSGVKKMMYWSEANWWYGNFWSKNTQYGNTNNE